MTSGQHDAASRAGPRGPEETYRGMSGLLSTAGGAIARNAVRRAKAPWIGADPATGVPGDVEKEVQNSARF